MSCSPALQLTGRSFMPIDPANLRVTHQVSQFSWYALYTRHQHEKSVAQVLQGKGFEVFLPLYATTHRWKDRTKLLSLPLFPCYVFLNGGLERRLDILTAPGIHALVSYAGRPAEIPFTEIEAVRRAIDSGAYVEPHPLLKSGDRVRVKSGSLEGVQGILLRKRNVYRLVLSVEMLGKAVVMEVDAHTVERARSVPSKPFRN
jgi:transcription antitermination factor NusG